MLQRCLRRRVALLSNNRAPKKRLIQGFNLSRFKSSNTPNVDPFLTASRPRDFWLYQPNQKRFWDHAAVALGFDGAHLDQWYKFALTDVSKVIGAANTVWIRDMYRGNLYRALEAAYPEHTFQAWLFAAVPLGFWAEQANHRRYFDWLRGRLGIAENQLHLFYSVTVDTIYQNRGRALLRTYYGSSLPTALVRIYPEHQWQVWKFTYARVPRNFWAELDNQRTYFQALCSEILNSDMNGWYNWTSAALQAAYPESACILRQFYGGSLVQALTVLFPEHTWDLTKFTKGPKFEHDNDSTEEAKSTT